jgi:hypothetical protein
MKYSIHLVDRTSVAWVSIKTRTHPCSRPVWQFPLNRWNHRRSYFQTRNLNVNSTTKSKKMRIQCRVPYFVLKSHIARLQREIHWLRVISRYKNSKRSMEYRVRVTSQRKLMISRIHLFIFMKQRFPRRNKRNQIWNLKVKCSVWKVIKKTIWLERWLMGNGQRVV